MSRSRRRTTGIVLMLTSLIVVLGLVPTTIADVPAPPFANFESTQINPVRLSADNTRLFAVNPANQSMSVFDVRQPASPALIAQILVGIGPASVNPRTNDEAWVVNQVSNSVSIVSASQGIVTDTISTGAGTEPVDVVFAGANQAYVSCSRSNQIKVFDTRTHALLATVPLFGGSPRALAVSNDGSTVYAAFAISGNATTIIPPQIAPPPPPPQNPNLPPPPQVALIVAANDQQWKHYVTFQMPDNDVVAITTGSAPLATRYYPGVGTINLGLAVSLANGDLFVANTDALNLISFEPNLRGHWINNRITRIDPASGQVSPFNLNPNIDYKILPNPQALSTALSQPTAVVFDPSGTFMYVAAFGTDRVAQVDANGNVLNFVEVSLPSGSGSNADPKNKRGPRGLALNSAAHVLYAQNTISNTIAVINTAQMTEVNEVPVGTDSTPTAIKQGRGFLYDAKLSGNGTGACASCHVDGDFDHLAWNLGDRDGKMAFEQRNGHLFKFHPMKGPMTTQTLRGLVGMNPYHWRGEKVDFASFDSTFDTLMGGSQVSTADMTIYQDFINSLTFLPNPNENLDRSLPTSLDGGNPAAGRDAFLHARGTGGAATCNSCHTANPGPGTDLFLLVFNPQVLKVPHLRNIYQKLAYNRHATQSIDGVGMGHDGSTSTLGDFLALPFFKGYSTQQKFDLASYMLCFDTGTAPAVGYTITLTAANINNQQEQSDWTTLQSQAGVANIDLVGHGTIQGQIRSLLYEPRKNLYISNLNVEYTQTQLQNFVKNGDTLSFMGVFPGTGTN